MSMPVHERALWLPRWRRLVDDVAAAAGDPARSALDLKPRALDASGAWRSPCGHAHNDSTVLWALAAMAKAYVYETAAKRRSALAPPILAWCELARAALDRCEPPPAPAPPVLRHRADLDG